MASVGRHTKWVTLSRSPNANGDPPFEPLSPEGAWASISPQLSVGDSNRTVEHLVEMRFHPGVTLDTRIVYEDTSRTTPLELFVRGVQNVNMDNDLLRLICEEVQA